MSSNDLDHLSHGGELVVVSSRGQSPVDEALESTSSSNAMVLVTASTNKKRKTSETSSASTTQVPSSQPSASSTSRQPARLSEDKKRLLDMNVEEILTIMKLKRKGAHALKMYENFAENGKCPKDIDIAVKFGNPYPKLVSRYYDLATPEELAKMEENIWERAKKDIIQLRLHVLRESVIEAETYLRDSVEIGSNVIPAGSPDEFRLIANYFTTRRDEKMAELQAHFDKLDKAYEARVAKKIAKQSQNSIPMDTETADNDEPTIKSLVTMMKSLETSLLKVQTDLADLRKPNKGSKNAKAPSARGRGAPVQTAYEGDLSSPPPITRPPDLTWAQIASLAALLPPPSAFPLRPPTAFNGDTTQNGFGGERNRRPPPRTGRGGPPKNKKPENKRNNNKKGKQTNNSGNARASESSARR